MLYAYHPLYIRRLVLDRIITCIAQLLYNVRISSTLQEVLFKAELYTPDLCLLNKHTCTIFK